VPLENSHLIEGWRHPGRPPGWVVVAACCAHNILGTVANAGEQVEPRSKRCTKVRNEYT